MATLLTTSGSLGNAGNRHPGGLEEDPPVLTLDAKGMIRHCNRAASKMMGCTSSDLVWQHVSSLLPQLSDSALMHDGQISQKLLFLSRIGHHFRLAMPNGNTTFARIFINDLENAGRHTVRLIMYPDPQFESGHLVS